MYKHVFCAALLFSSCSSYLSTPENCTKKMVCEYKIETKKFDYVVNLDFYANACSGVIMGKYSIITAKHCLMEELGPSSYFRVNNAKYIVGEVKTFDDDPILKYIVVLYVTTELDYSESITIPKDFHDKDDIIAFVGYGALQVCGDMSVLQFYGHGTKRVQYIRGNQMSYSGHYSSYICAFSGDSGGAVINVTKKELIAIAESFLYTDTDRMVYHRAVFTPVIGADLTLR